MPSRTTLHASAGPDAEALKAQLATSSASTIYVDAPEPTADDLAALLAQGVHAEWDVLRSKLAVRLATPDEMPQPEAAAEPTTTL